MGVSVKTYRTFDDEGLRRAMVDPDMWATVAEDGHDPANYKPDVVAECWLAMQVDGNVVAYYQLESRNTVTLEIHAQVLPEFRKEYSKATGEAALKWILENAPECQKVIAWVPSKYPNVRDFTLQFGFKVEGTNRKSYLKDGQLWDQWLLGITRGEIHEQYS
jgi:hypothetical protein